MGSLIFENTVYVNDPTWSFVNNSTVRTKTIFGKSAIGHKQTVMYFYPGPKYSIIATGTPEEVAQIAGSFTGKYLKRILDNNKLTRKKAG